MIKKEKSQQQHVIGAMECTVNGRYNNLIVILRENPTCYFYYPWYMQICSTGVFFFLPVQVNTPAGLKGQEVTR